MKGIFFSTTISRMKRKFFTSPRKCGYFFFFFLRQSCRRNLSEMSQIAKRSMKISNNKNCKCTYLLKNEFDSEVTIEFKERLID